MNPTQVEVKEMEKEVDPNDTGSFDQVSLIGLISSKPRQDEKLEEMVTALKTIVKNQGGEEEGDVNKISLETLNYMMTHQGEQL